MADVKWIKLSIDIFNNRKIKQISKLPDGDTILVIWFQLMCLAGSINDNGMIYITRELPYTEETFANEFERPVATVRLALKVFEQFEMIEIIDNFLLLPSWCDYQSAEKLEKIKEQNRIRKQRQREKGTMLLEDVTQNVTHDVTQNVTHDVTQCHATEQIRKEKNNIYVDFFNLIWDKYPIKKGKASVKKTQIEKLHKIGIEEMTRAISRYIKEMDGTDKQYWKHGSTFFNSGYVDYLDENYKETKEESKTTTREVVIEW